MKKFGSKTKLYILVILLIFAALFSLFLAVFCRDYFSITIIQTIFNVLLFIVMLLQLSILEREERKAERKLKFKLFKTFSGDKVVYEITAFNQSTEGNAIYKVNITHNSADVRYNYASIDFSPKAPYGREGYYYLPYRKQYFIIEQEGVIQPLSIPKSEARVFALFFDTVTITEQIAVNARELGNVDLPIFKITIEDFRGNIYEKEVNVKEETLNF